MPRNLHPFSDEKMRQQSGGFPTAGIDMRLPSHGASPEKKTPACKYRFTKYHFTLLSQRTIFRHMDIAPGGRKTAAPLPVLLLDTKHMLELPPGIFVGFAAPPR
jgi:hypothetical protein